MAVTAVRRHLRLGTARVRSSGWSVGQSALAAAAAWELGVRLLHHAGPFFAAVAAIVALSTSHLNRLRRVGEMAIGVTLGVGLGDLLVRQIGRGALQLGLVVFVAMTVGLVVDGAVLIVNQAALQAVFVAALPPPANGYLGRWEDALLGGVVALAVAALLPGDPRAGVRREADVTLVTVARALRAGATAARRGDVDAAIGALESARGTAPMLDRWRDAVRAGAEISRISPLRRGANPEIAAHRAALAPVDNAVRNVRVALRRVVAAVEDAQHAPPGTAPEMPGALLELLDQLAGAFYTLPGALRDPAGEGGRRAAGALREIAGALDPRTVGARSMSATVVLAQIRSAVVDLLQAVGVSEPDARALVRR